MNSLSKQPSGSSAAHTIAPGAAPSAGRDGAAGSTVYSIQALRALAAALVVVVHLGRAMQLKAGIDPTSVTFNCGVGVDVFFVISGFIMVRTTPPPFSPRTFLLRRLVRVAPLYWLLTFAYGMALLAAPGLSAFNHFKLDNFLLAFLFVPSHDSQGTVLPPLEQGWTLVYEAFFYVCLALASVAAYRRRVAALAGAFGLLVAAGAVSPLASNVLVDTYTNPILLEFAAGCVIGKLYDPARPRMGAPWAVALVALSTLSVAAGALLPWGAVPRVVEWGIPAAAAVWAFLQLEHVVAFGRLGVLRTLGDSSYAVYLTHVFTLSVLALAFKIEWLRGDAALAIAPVLLVICLVAGWVCHRVIERPLTNAARSRLLPRRAPVSAKLRKGEAVEL
jgi:peptidoglycan/LPS O-acetylase OafA/YrhL